MNNRQGARIPKDQAVIRSGDPHNRGPAGRLCCGPPLRGREPPYRHGSCRRKDRKPDDYGVEHGGVGSSRSRLSVRTLAFRRAPTRSASAPRRPTQASPRALPRTGGPPLVIAGNCLSLTTPGLKTVPVPRLLTLQRSGGFPHRTQRRRPLRGRGDQRYWIRTTEPAGRPSGGELTSSECGDSALDFDRAGQSRDASLSLGRQPASHPNTGVEDSPETHDGRSRSRSSHKALALESAA